MQNIEPHDFEAIDFVLESLLIEVRKEERKDRALAVSMRLEALATHIIQKGMNGADAADLLRREAERYEKQSLELH